MSFIRHIDEVKLVHRLSDCLQKGINTKTLDFECFSAIAV